MCVLYEMKKKHEEVLEGLKVNNCEYKITSVTKTKYVQNSLDLLCRYVAFN